MEDMMFDPHTNIFIQGRNIDISSLPALIRIAEYALEGR